MRPSIRHGAFGLGLLGVLAVAGAYAQTKSPNDSDVTGSIAVRTASALPLSEEERNQIYEGVMRMPDAPLAEVEPPSVAATLPSSVQLQDLPGSVLRDVPLVKGHKFVKFDDRILVVNPASRRVVAQIPRYKIMLQ